MSVGLKMNESLITGAGTGNFVRLKSLAQSRGRDVQSVVTRFSLEAALRRIFTSEHASKFGVTSLKGGSLMFFSEGVDPVDGRATRDIDLQIGGFAGTMEELATIMKAVLSEVPAVDDGVRFDTEHLVVTGTRDGGVPGGSVETTVQIGRAVVRFKVDVGFYPLAAAEELELVDYPSLLPSQLSPIPVYRQPMECSIADKFHAAVRHGAGTGRLRDFYDVYVMMTRCQLDDDRIVAALRKTFPLYGSELPASVDDIAAYSDQFAAENAGRWGALRERSGWAVDVPDLATVVSTIRNRIGPLLERPNEPVYGVAA